MFALIFFQTRENLFTIFIISREKTLSYAQKMSLPVPKE